MRDKPKLDDMKQPENDGWGEFPVEDWTDQEDEEQSTEREGRDPRPKQ